MAWLWWRRKDASDRRHRPLSWRWIAFYAAMALSIGGAVMWSLWPPPLKSLAEEIKARANAVQVGLVAVGAAGAAFTLWLAVRRQSTTEEDSRQQRMTELYTAAVEQLGHDSAAVRLGALYALQRLGQTYPEQRRAIVNVWCAYLRMPFRGPAADGLEEEEHEKRRQELEVRLTVQRLLREHAHSGPHNGKPASPRFWGDELDVDLTGATLHQLDLSGCRIHPNTTFTKATFTGETSFLEATFTDRVLFNKATFTSHVLLRPRSPATPGSTRPRSPAKPRSTVPRSPTAPRSPRPRSPATPRSTVPRSPATPSSRVWWLPALASTFGRWGGSWCQRMMWTSLKVVIRTPPGGGWCS